MCPYPASEPKWSGNSDKRPLAVVHRADEVAGEEAGSRALVPGFGESRLVVDDAGEGLDRPHDLVAADLADAGAEQPVDAGVAGATPQQPDRLLGFAAHQFVGILQHRHQAPGIGELARTLEPFDALEAGFALKRHDRLGSGRLGNGRLGSGGWAVAGPAVARIAGGCRAAGADERSRPAARPPVRCLRRRFAVFSQRTLQPLNESVGAQTLTRMAAAPKVARRLRRRRGRHPSVELAAASAGTTAAARTAARCFRLRRSGHQDLDQPQAQRRERQQQARCG